MQTTKATIKDSGGGTYKLQKTADLTRSAKIEAYSTSRREYEESHLDATMAMHRAVGFILMAEELEPYNPEVLWEKAFITEMSGKSTHYMRELTVNAIVKYIVCKEHGYDPRETPLDIMKYAAEDYLRDIEKGITYQGKS